MKTLYRIEHGATGNSMWYNKDGTMNNIIFGLTEGNAKKTPMPYNPIHYKDGRTWISTCDSLEQLKLWFSPKDRRELLALGFILCKNL